MLVSPLRAAGDLSPPAASDASGIPLALAVRLNGHETGLIGEFIDRKGILFARPDELAAIGLEVPASVAPAVDGLIALPALTGVTWHLDTATQTLELSAPDARIRPGRLQLGAEPAPTPPMARAAGAGLDYILTGQRADGPSSAQGWFDLRGFAGLGVINTSFLGFSGERSTLPGAERLIRLDSQYSYADPDALRRYTLGDFISAGLSWTRPVRLGGARYDADFALRPDLVTMPLPSFVGSSAVPTTADVLINGTRVYSGQVAPGPFEIPRLPVVSGAGTVAVAVTDALGRQVVTEMPFYAASELLAPGLQTFSLETGKLRRGWGQMNDGYGDPAGLATWRRGISQYLTVEAHAEGGGDVQMAGAGASLNVANRGVLQLAAAGSRDDAGSGQRYGLGFQHLGRRFSFGASLLQTAKDFRDLATLDGNLVPRRQLSANAGVTLGRWGSVGLGYTVLERDALANPAYVAPSMLPPNPYPLIHPPEPAALARVEPRYLQPAERARILTASHSVQLLNLSVYFTGFADLEQQGDYGMLAGIALPWGDRDSLGVSIHHDGDAQNLQLQAQRSTQAVGDWGYQFYGSAGEQDRAFADLAYKSPWARLSVGADRGAQTTTLKATAEGALTYVDGGLFATNPIRDSFAIVNTDGIAGVPVLFENREVGQTDASGRLLVPELRAYDVNQLAIDPTAVPPDTAITETSQRVRPGARSGVVVSFPMRISQSALLELIDESGRPIPLGSTARLGAGGIDVPVGHDGQTYIEGLAAENTLRVEQPDGRRCVVRFKYQRVPGTIPVLGPLLCREQAP